MSVEALKDAQLQNALKENNTLKATIRNLSGQVIAQKQCIDEYLSANITLRSSTILLEDDVKSMSKTISSLVERIEKLECENKELHPIKDEVLVKNCS